MRRESVLSNPSLHLDLGFAVGFTTRSCLVRHTIEKQNLGRTVPLCIVRPQTFDRTNLLICLTSFLSLLASGWLFCFFFFFRVLKYFFLHPIKARTPSHWSFKATSNQRFPTHHFLSTCTGHISAVSDHQCQDVSSSARSISIQRSATISI